MVCLVLVEQHQENDDDEADNPRRQKAIMEGSDRAVNGGKDSGEVDARKRYRQQEPRFVSHERKVAMPARQRAGTRGGATHWDRPAPIQLSPAGLTNEGFRDRRGGPGQAPDQPFRSCVRNVVSPRTPSGEYRDPGIRAVLAT